MWEKFSKEVDGNFVNAFSWHSAKTEIDYKGLKIIFDNYRLWSGKHSKNMTRVVVRYYSTENFTFEISETSFVKIITKLLGSQDLEIGRDDFDKKFIVKTNNEQKTKTLLQNQEIRSLIEQQKNINLLISKQNGIWEEMLTEGNYELSFYEDGEIEDIERLKSLLKLFKEFIDVFINLKIISEIHN